MRIITLTLCVGISLLLMCNVIPVHKDDSGKSVGIGFGNGMVYGLDFAGGIQMQLKLERPLNADEMAIETGILEYRLNAIGLKDIPVRQWGDQYILIQIADASPAMIKNVEDILKQQARFEARIDGELAMEGSEITVDLSPQGSGISDMQNGYYWSVGMQNSKEGGDRFCEVGKSKRDYPIDMFLDRPENTIILMVNSTYAVLVEMLDSHGDSYITLIENRSLIPVVIAENVIENNTLNLAKLAEFSNHNVIIAADEDQISDTIRNEFEENNFTTERKPEEGLKEDWVNGLIGLSSSPKLNCDPCTQCKYNAQITGTSPTLEDAKEEIKRNQILLTSGNLPAKAFIESRSTTPPSLGTRFLKYSFITAIIGVITVSIVIFIRYRKLFIVIPTIITGFSEIIIILGVAALIRWEIDLPAVAGIIAAVGTGVDDQIVITDETIKRSVGKTKERIINIAERIRRAFFIIFTAAATTIAVMLPIMSISAGLLRGFAFTTILGVLIGVFITRPAYAKIIEYLLEKQD